ERPNVVFFLVDDLGYMDVGANNPETFYETPNIDELALMGARFTNGYAANPVCSPTRFSILTGKYPTRAGATNYFSGRRSAKFNPAPLNNSMPLEEVTLAEALKEEGYRTFFAGKWHLGPNADYFPTKQGFDINRGGHTAGGPYTGKRYFAPFKNPELKDLPTDKHLPMRLADEASQFIRESKDKPFFAYLAFYSVHTPLMGPKPLVEKYQKKSENLELAKKQQFADEEQVWQGPKAGRRQVRILQSHAVYAAMVESMDTAVGKVMDTLKELDLLDNTIVCLTSDNGGLSTSEGSPTSNLPLRGGKGWVYEGGIREPFIIYAPGKSKPGAVIDTPVISTDFYPTILNLVGAKPRPKQHLDGVQLTSLLNGKGAIDRDALYWHYPHYPNQGAFPGGAIRMGNYKLIERYEDGRVHLYDLNANIGESVDLADKQPERVADMRKRLHDWYKTVDAKFLQPKGDAIPWQPEL
ncbi:MAG: sulfatase, partial [bacterium]|nr:sulfatase [bacterium]